MFSSALLSLALFFASLILPTLSTPSKDRDPNWHPHPLPLPAKVIHQFPVGTWLESLAFRRNGDILTTALSSPEVFLVDHHDAKPVKVVHTFANATSCTGITRLGRDVFYVIAGNFSLSTFEAVPGSWSVYRVDVRHHHPHTTKPKPAEVSWVANFPDSIMLSGITVLNKWKKWLLVSDSSAGVVYRLEIKTGKVVKVLDEPLMKPSSSSFGVGIKGIAVPTNHLFNRRHPVLFFTNTDRNILGLMEIEHNGTPRSLIGVIASIDRPGGFAITIKDRNYVAQTGPDLLGVVDQYSGDFPRFQTVYDTLANGADSQLFGPTDVGFAHVGTDGDPHHKGWNNAYMSTNGGTAQYLTGNITRGGTISVVNRKGYATK